MNKNHLRNVRALLENAKSFNVSRKVDSYEFESLEKMILDDQIRYSEVIELFTDTEYRNWFYDRNFANEKEIEITRFSDL
jgi:LAS superfamily LD-carboxypeptidase LdcB